MRFGSAYQIEKALRDGRLFKMEKGVYSESGNESEIEVLQAKYPNTVVSFDSAYFYYDMTDYVPEKYTLTIPDHARPIHDIRIKLPFVPERVLLVGVTTFDYNDSKIRIYDKERLLIDTARMKGRMPPDLYKEVVNHYRQIKDELDGSKFPEYLELFPHRERIMQIIDTEVF
jgi:predicted transcriptional regulator of viral defense system